ncbi:unknown [Acetobacter sp. CAG:977]|nr:unknown [Acetobacter sp. CAG:977]
MPRTKELISLQEPATTSCTAETIMMILAETKVMMSCTEVTATIRLKEEAETIFLRAVRAMIR